MPANTNPIYVLTPHIGWANTDGDGGTAGPLKTANTAKDGTGTVLTIFTATTNGSFVREVRARAAGTCTASVLRLFVNNGSSQTTLGNNSLIDEVSLPSTTLSEISSLTPVILPVNFALPNGYKLMVTLGTTVSAGYFISVVAGDY